MDQENGQGVVMTQSGCVYLADLSSRQMTLLNGAMDSRFPFQVYELSSELFLSVSSNNTAKMFSSQSGEMLSEYQYPYN